MPNRCLFISILVAACSFALGCGGYDAGGPYPGAGAGPGGYGATPGGAQDINYARGLIDEGSVPPADAITVEGLLSQHDLPTEGAPCEDLLCARPAIAIAPSLETGERAYWLQLGMTSGIAEFVRPPMDVTVVIDRSSSMSGDMAETNEAVTRLIRQLREDDALSIIAYNDGVETIHEHGPVTDADALIDRVRGIDANGGANMYRGLDAAYTIQREVGESQARLRRVVVLSCGYPDTYSDVAFQELVAAGGADRIGLTFVGVLLPFDYSLAQLLSEERGGNYFYTGTLEEIEQVFDTDFDFAMTPLAYDLRFGVELADGFEVDRVFGIPGDAEGEPRTDLEVATAFISRRRGGILIRLRETEESIDKRLGSVSLAYNPESAHGWTEAFTSTAEAGWEADVEPDGVLWGGDGVRKAVALVNTAERMQAACTAFHDGDRAEATAILEELVSHLGDEAEALDDDGLRDELALVEALLDNVAR